jgi:glycosyltransferase involved in cell wall biosynthesis
MLNHSLFLTLRVFSATGGIEKVCMVAGKALYELTGDKIKSTLHILSMYDRQEELDTKYFPAEIFRGFGKNKFQFVRAAFQTGINSRQVILSHVNLLLPGVLIKLFAPNTRLILIAHGIEVWSPFSFGKRYLLRKCDHILAVSNFTKQKLVEVHGIAEDKITILNNCLDPFLEPPLQTGKNKALLDRYALAPDHFVLLTITRLASREQYKGYDNVLYALKILTATNPAIRYLVAGKYDAAEKQRLDQLVSELSLEQYVIFAGYIPDEELAAHYSIADCYIMPSKKEGFGIVFIEAMYYGKPVIGGNKDGSMDALDNGKLGIPVNPDSIQEIAAAIVKVMGNTAAYIPDRQLVMAKFSYPVYKENLRRALTPSQSPLSP